jgi:hypothetical protein
MQKADAEGRCTRPMKKAHKKSRSKDRLLVDAEVCDQKLWRTPKASEVWSPMLTRLAGILASSTLV